MNKLFLALALLACLTINACAAAMTETPSAADSETNLAKLDGVTVTLMSFGAPMVGDTAAQALYTVLGGSTGNTTIEAALPDELKTGLQEALAQTPQDLYIVLYAGPQPSSGYAVQIEDVQLNGEELQISYRVAPPPPSTGAATVITHPYVLLRAHGEKVASLRVTFIETK
jgi:hypothetical protein